ncbi:antitoxin PaaA2 family protein [Sphingomonas changbaiensis]|uniref:antitoxin PaaA2 family protein n=1 Tax=Sphingomonas changbaiensis TaxID=529705 RepID=UPI001FE103F9|nr:hypothetical protein [Sphingomonas changbaiensis]
MPDLIRHPPAFPSLKSEGGPRIKSGVTEKSGHLQLLCVVAYSYADEPLLAHRVAVCSAEEEAAYLAWLQERVAVSFAKPRPPVSHDEVMPELGA